MMSPAILVFSLIIEGTGTASAFLLNLRANFKNNIFFNFVIFIQLLNFGFEEGQRINVDTLVEHLIMEVRPG